MAVLKSNTLRPIFIRPVSLGEAARSAEFYVIDPQLGTMTRISEALVPQTQLVADGGGTYSFRQQNGWIVDVPHISKSNETWIAWSVGDDIQVETPSFKFRVLEDEVQIQVRVMGLVGHYVVTSARRKVEISGWFWFPWSRTWFIDNDSDRLRCMPFTELLCDLSDSRHAKTLASQWAMGIRVVSNAFRLPQNLQWSDSL